MPHYESVVTQKLIYLTLTKNTWVCFVCMTEDIALDCTTLLNAAVNGLSKAERGQWHRTFAVLNATDSGHCCAYGTTITATYPPKKVNFVSPNFNITIAICNVIVLDDKPEVREPGTATEKKVF